MLWLTLDYLCLSRFIFINILVMQVPAASRLRLEESLVKRLLLRIRTESPSDTWFDEVQAAVYEKLQVVPTVSLLCRK